MRSLEAGVTNHTVVCPAAASRRSGLAGEPAGADGPGRSDCWESELDALRDHQEIRRCCLGVRKHQSDSSRERCQQHQSDYSEVQFGRLARQERFDR